MADHRGWLEAQGEVAEFGGKRILLPESFYPVRVTIEEVGTSKENDDGSGGSVFVQLNGLVYDPKCPFSGNDQSARIWLTPGKTGAYMGWLAATVKAITGQPVDTTALDKFGINPEGNDKEELRESFREQYLTLTVEERLAFMIQYARLNTWDGRQCIAHVTHEASNRAKVDEATGQEYFPVFGRFQGFYSLTDAKKGLQFVQQVCYATQAEHKAAMDAAQVSA